jgi:hypothetical protein
MVDTNTAVRAPEALNPHEACKAEIETLARIGDKWTVTVVAPCRKDRCVPLLATVKNSLASAAARAP